MKTSKKILLIIVSILISSGIAAAIAAPLAGLAMLAGIKYFSAAIPLFFLILALQVVGPFIWDKYIMDIRQLTLMEEYAKKPFREYKIDVQCAGCGATNLIATDFVDAEFTCTTCGKDNKVEPHFFTYVKTIPVNEIDDVSIMNQINNI